MGPAWQGTASDPPYGQTTDNEVATARRRTDGHPIQIGTAAATERESSHRGSSLGAADALIIGFEWSVR